MSYPINYPTPQGANVQIFQAPVRAVTTAWTTEWVKPQGASFVWFTLIGAGGGGAGGDGTVNTVGGGGSGAVTNCMVPAFLIPDVLQVRVGKGGAAGVGSGGSGVDGTATTIVYQQKSTTGYTLVTANAGVAGTNASNGTGGATTASNGFSCAGFYQSIAGQAGGVFGPSATTFLEGGDSATASTSTYTDLYGYSVSKSTGTGDGFFMMQPIIVGIGGKGVGNSPWPAGKGGIGCGGASGLNTGSSGAGGDGLVVIITW